MPLDPSIPLSVRPAQIEDPLAAYGKVMAIQGAQQAQQAGAQRLQMGELELQQQKRAVEYQKTFTDALQKHTVKNPNGSLATDWSGVQDRLTDAGYGPEALKLNTERMQAQEAGLKLLHEQNQADLDRAQFVSRTVGALPQVDTAATPEVQAQQKAAWSASAIAGIGNLVKGGHMAPAQAAPILQQIQQTGWTPELAEQARQLQMQGLSTEQQIQHVQNGINAAREGKVANASVAHSTAETAKLDAEALDKGKSDAAVQLSGATNAADYDARRAKLDPKVAALLPESKTLDFTDPKKLKDTQESILTSGMNAQQLQQHLDRKDAQRTRDLAAESLAESRTANEEFRRFMTQGQPSPAQRKASSTIDFIDKGEPGLWKTAGAIAAQLKDGNPLNVTTYVSKTGSAIPMDEHLKQDSGKKVSHEDAVRDMQSNLDATKDAIRKGINKKYDLMEQNGGEPSVSRADALKAVDGLGPQAKAAASPAQKTPVAAKPQAPAAPQKWKDDKGGTWEQNQMVWGPDGKKYLVTGYRDGKVLTKPAPAQ